MRELDYHRQTPNIITGTGLQGYINATFEQLTKVFGEPNIMKDYDKVTHLWVLNIEGVIATIYDYKQNLNTGKAENWHIGGKQKIAVKLIEQILADNK